MLADALAHRALAQVIAPWDTGVEALGLGASLDRELPSGVVNTAVRARVTKIGAHLYLVIVEARVGADADAARRRMRLLVARGRALDSASVDSAPHFTRWGVSELY